MISPTKTASPVGESLWMATLCGMPASWLSKLIVNVVFAGTVNSVTSNAMFRPRC